ncbi:hypothetical protein PATY110618_24220 [Paenibacillus typhae]|uniref:Uncharacterized protein n=1 Tax=Paenibacillus typhae TaxID=1174501 RepID=A0A1G8F9C9_9BACL|nr:hypothetical protein SAMN05216192_101170 [Paenibacillus typhae]
MIKDSILLNLPGEVACLSKKGLFLSILQSKTINDVLQTPLQKAPSECFSDRMSVHFIMREVFF